MFWVAFLKIVLMLWNFRRPVCVVRFREGNTRKSDLSKFDPRLEDGGGKNGTSAEDP